MKRKTKAPRNPYVAAALFKRAGAHGKPGKALRSAEKIQHKRNVAEWQGNGLLIHTRRSSNLPVPTRALTQAPVCASVLQF